jgi:hypothetical protein
MYLLHDLASRRFLPVLASRRRSWGVLLLFLAVALAMPAVLQAQETTAAIRGKVVDAAGAPVANAQVEVLDQRTGIIRSFTTSDSGAFLATRLPPGGPYTVIVNETRTVVVDSISVSNVYSLTIDIDAVQLTEEIEVVGESLVLVDVAPGPAGTFSTFEVETAPAFNRDIVEVYGIDPRINIDSEQRGFQVNCAGKHPRFNSVTLDGVSYNDRFGLNSNGYNTAVGMPFPFDGVAQVAVELAPLDVTYGGFSACNINSVTKSGTNEFHGNVFYEHTGDNLRRNLSADPPSFNDRFWGATLGGPIIKDKLFFFAAYENSSQFVPLAMGFAGSGVGEERPWYTQADHERIERIARDVYGYDTGGLPSDGAREADKILLKLNWNISPKHNLAAIFNYFDGFEDRASDNDPFEFEYANHFYQKGAESKTYTAKLSSQWTNVFSTELFVSRNEMNDSQVTVGPKDFGDFQISVNGRQNVVYLGADDSRQANALNTKSDFFKLQGQYLAGNHVITGGYERESLTIFNQFVQHSRGGEYDFFDDSGGNPDFCAGLTAQGRLDNPLCDLSGIDRFELGRPSRIYYGSGGGTNDPVTASAEFTNAKNAFYVQDSIFIDKHNLTLVAGLRYEFFTSGDRPVFNPTFTEANGGLRNDANIDGVSLWMPRLGVTWGISDNLVLRGGVGRYSGGNPNVWLSNAWSNDGLTNVQTRLNNFDASGSLFDGSIPLTGNEPGRETSVPQAQFDRVANTTPDDANDSFLVLIDPNYVQPSEWKLTAGGTYRLPGDVQWDFDYLHTRMSDAAHYVDLSQEVVGNTRAGGPIYAYSTGRDNFMLTNAEATASSNVFSVSFSKFWLSGLDVFVGYAYVDAKDVVPMTSSVAGSNFENVALNDINNPIAGITNYRVPHRFTLRASFGRKFFWDSETRFTLYGVLQEGQPTTWVMGSDGLEGDPIPARHLLYVPTGPDDPNVVFGAGFDVNEFFAWVDREGLSPGFVARNERNAKWTSRVDFRIDQEVPVGLGAARARVYLKLRNVGNLLKGTTPPDPEDWGLVWDAPFFSRQVVESEVNDAGQYVFESFTDLEASDLVESQSGWEVRLGVAFRF